VAEVVLVLLCFWFSGWKPALVFRFSYAWEMLVFGIKIMGSRIQWYMYSNADYLLVGRMLGKDMLGHYTMAFRLATLPTEKVTAVVNQVMFPAFSQLQNDLPSLCQAFLKTTSYVSLITFPLLAIIAAFAPEIVVGLLTDKWLPSVFPLRVLCVIGLLRSVDVIIPQVLVARGRATLIFKYTTLLMCVLPASFAAGCYLGGINGVAYAWMLAYPPLSACLMFFGLRELELPLMRCHTPPTTLGCGGHGFISVNSKDVSFAGRDRLKSVACRCWNDLWFIYLLRLSGYFSW
jgi:O-antigen/teichoic acid export membrane protein